MYYAGYRDGPYFLRTDANKFAVGAVQSEPHSAGEKVIAYYGRKLHNPET
jgi:hypothetical protein